MKNLLIAVFITLNFPVLAQTDMHLEFPLDGNKAELSFNDCNLINVKGWENNYIDIVAHVSINGGKNNDSYQITRDVQNSGTISGIIKNKEDLPRMIRVKKGDETFIFETSDIDSPEIKAFYKEHGKDNISWISHGVSWDIIIDIKIPYNAALTISSKHGMIDIEDFKGQVTANSKHGGVDFETGKNSNYVFILESDWGEIYSNLDLKYDQTGLNKNTMATVIKASINNGGGPLIDLESKHGNIYLREVQ